MSDIKAKFITLGCRLNACETVAMHDMAQKAGVREAVVINTCAVTAEAVRSGKQAIRRMRRENPGAAVIVTGCGAQTDPASYARMEEVDLVIGNAEKMRPSVWSEIAKSGGFLPETEKVKVDDIMSVRETASHLAKGFGTRSRAYVQIQNGCDHRCTFCIIPYGRGNSRSVPAGAVVERIKALVGAGYNEVVLTGVDLTSWGEDLPGKPPLGDLVQRILRLAPDLKRLRLSSIDSIEADQGLFDAMSESAVLMPHLHLSLQAGDNMILKRMKRRHLRDDAIEFCERMRKARPDVVFGADIIAGFPTETESMFEKSLDLVEECGLTWLHVFPYSPRNGTPAARMPQVPRPEIKARAARLREAGTRRIKAHLESQAGLTRQILMEKNRFGRTEQFAEVETASDHDPGAVVALRIEGSDGERLLA